MTPWAATSRRISAVAVAAALLHPAAEAAEATARLPRLTAERSEAATAVVAATATVGAAAEAAADTAAGATAAAGAAAAMTGASSFFVGAAFSLLLFVPG